MLIKNNHGELQDVMEIIKDLQRICKKQREEIKLLKKHNTPNQGFDFGDLLNNIKDK